MLEQYSKQSVDIANRYGDDCVFIGEDMEVAGAFGMNIALKNAGHSDKLVDMPLCEAIIVHTGTGAALSGMRPMVEIQFGGFAALGFNALVNNAAMLRWRWGADCPMTIRIPLGAKTRSGPFHANMIESWFANDLNYHRSSALVLLRMHTIYLLRLPKSMIR